MPIIIVNDGSDGELEIKNAIILKHDKNLGKGAAIKTGMKYAKEQCFTHIFQIDADMQHDLHMIDEFLKVYEKDKNSLIIGYGKYDETIPKSRLYGRKITDLWVYINTLGGKFKDCMTGFRIYPINLEILEKTSSNRMEFDIEIIINYYKFDINLIWMEVGVTYGAVSHFMKFKDNFLISLMHARVFFALPKFIYKKIK